MSKLIAHCHCGSVQLSTTRLPETLLACNCSICNRVGALWAYYKPEEIVLPASNLTGTYVWGDGNCELHHCLNCGNTTHYLPTSISENKLIGLNARMFPLETLESIPVRRFDGADSWTFIDS